jgi:hypothetical protein
MVVVRSCALAGAGARRETPFQMGWSSAAQGGAASGKMRNYPAKQDKIKNAVTAALRGVGSGA